MRSKHRPTGQDYHSSIENARRAQIITSTIETIATVGYAQASLHQIAHRAGISKSVLLYHFESKDDLIEHVVIDIYTVATNFMLQKIVTQSDALSMLRTYIQANVEFIGTHRLQLTALSEIMNNFRNPNGTHRYDITAEEPVLAALQALLSKGQQDGEFRTFDTRVMAITIRRAIDALPPLLEVDPDLDLGTYAQELMTLFEMATRNALLQKE